MDELDYTTSKTVDIRKPIIREYNKWKGSDKKLNESDEWKYWYMMLTHHLRKICEQYSDDRRDRIIIDRTIGFDRFVYSYILKIKEEDSVDETNNKKKIFEYMYPGFKFENVNSLLDSSEHTKKQINTSKQQQVHSNPSANLSANPLANPSANHSHISEINKIKKIFAVGKGTFSEIKTLLKIISNRPLLLGQKVELGLIEIQKEVSRKMIKYGNCTNGLANNPSEKNKQDNCIRKFQNQNSAVNRVGIFMRELIKNHLSQEINLQKSNVKEGHRSLEFKVNKIKRRKPAVKSKKVTENIHSNISIIKTKDGNIIELKKNDGTNEEEAIKVFVLKVDGLEKINFSTRSHTKLKIQCIELTKDGKIDYNKIYATPQTLKILIKKLRN